MHVIYQTTEEARGRVLFGISSSLAFLPFRTAQLQSPREARRYAREKARLDGGRGVGKGGNVGRAPNVQDDKKQPSTHAHHRADKGMGFPRRPSRVFLEGFHEAARPKTTIL